MLSCPMNNIPKYIGKTNNLSKRIAYHLLYDKKKSKKFDWIKSLRSRGLKPILEVIEITNENNWEFWEQHYISLYKSWGFELKNMTFGGDGNKLKRLPENWKRKIRESCKELGKGRKFSEEHRKNMSLSKTGKKTKKIYSEEERLKRVEWNKIHKSKPVLQYDLEGNFIREYTSIKEAEESINKTGLTHYFKGNFKHCGGYKWKYKIETLLTEDDYAS